MIEGMIRGLTGLAFCLLFLQMLQQQVLSFHEHGLGLDCEFLQNITTSCCLGRYRMWPFIGGLDSALRAGLCKLIAPIVSDIGLWLLPWALALVGHFISLPAEGQKTTNPIGY